MLSTQNLCKAPKNTRIKTFQVSVAIVLFAAISVFAQNPPATIRVAVTFYDFHSNRSNPEFEKTPTGTAVMLGMVANTLDAQRKPTLGPNPYWDCQIAKWFRPWTPGDFTIPNYTNPVTYTCSNPVSTVNYDTAFKNIVIQDSLTFTLVPGSAGTYQYNNANFFPLDNRGFGLEGQQHNYSFSMELHWEFKKIPGLTFQFEGDDDVWAFINNRLVMDIGGIHNATAGSVNVDNLGLTDNTKYMFDFFYSERHVTQSDIRITTNIISAAPDSLWMTAVPSNDTIKAGDSIVYIATVKDDTGGVRPEYNTRINWTVRATSADTLRAPTGANNVFKAYTAWRWDTLTATFQDPLNPTHILTHIAIVWVEPDTAYRVYIVGIGDTTRTSSNQNNPHPLDRVTLDSATNHDTVYAVVYDRYGNWVGKANSAAWASLDTTIKVNAVAGKTFAGNIDRNTRLPSSTFVTANQTALIGDSVSVVLQTGTIIDIRLVDAGNNPVTSVSITTDQTAYLKIQVIWSNAPGVWVDNGGSWTLDPNIIQWVNNPPAGNQVGNWTLDPKTPGQTNLTVMAGNKSLTIPITITVADPNRIALAILTPTIAGDTILIEQRIYNNDGLVPNYPGNWCKGDAMYSDTLVNSKLPTWVPTITIPNASGGSSITFGSKGIPCFQNGIDTIKVVLYDAPFTQDTLHQISVLLTTGNRTIKGSTTPFILYPGPLDSVSIEDASYKAISGPVTLNYPGGMLFFYSNGYDHYQNLIGHTLSSWTATPTLHAITPPDTGIFRIYYEAVDSNEQGFIVTQVPSGEHIGVMLSDSVEVIVNGSQASIDSAVTKDLNGNGYLDHIYVYFNKPVSITSDYGVSNITLRYSTMTLGIDSIRALTGSNNVFVIFLRDTINAQNGILTTGNPAPQTAWRPVLTLNNLPGGVRVANYTCRDGAGPVIWRVVVDRNPTDRTQDLVTVNFSEPIKSGITGDLFQANSTAPNSVFIIWERANGAFAKDTSGLLAGIAQFNSPPNDSTLTFFMTNGRELFTKYYFNIINNNGSSLISDKSTSKVGNLPIPDNQKVQVEIIGALGTLTVGPNPFVPTTDHSGPDGTINFKNEPEAIKWVKNGGTIFRVMISPGQGKVTGYLRVYDVVGNLVNSGQSDTNMITQIQNQNSADSSVVPYDVYWNGTNSHGMKAAPGAYLGVYYTTITKKNGANVTTSTKTRQVQKVGIRRGGS
jgi:fibro-slime domain-containing protein